MTIKQKLKDKLEKGYGICHGEANIITGHQSADRRLREMAQAEKLYYFMAKPNKKGGSEYKVFVSDREHVCAIRLQAGFRLIAQGIKRNHLSKMFRTQKQALKMLKCTQKEGNDG